MPDQLLNLFYGALGGGLVAAALRLIENEQIDKTLSALREIKGFLEQNGTIPAITNQGIDR